LAALLAGCANYVYEGEIQAPDSNGVERETQLYWTKTVPLIGRNKAGPAILRTACGTPVTYAQQSERIVFRGDPGKDRLAGQADNVAPGQECGRFVGRSRLADIPAGPVRLTIHCVPATGEFSIGRAYLKARQEPYEFDVHEDKHWSFLGRTPALPPPPACQ